MKRREVKTFYNYKVELTPNHNGIIKYDGEQKDIMDHTEFQFHSEYPLTYKQVTDKIKGTEGVLAIEGIFKV